MVVLGKPISGVETLSPPGRPVLKAPRHGGESGVLISLMHLIAVRLASPCRMANAATDDGRIKADRHFLTVDTMRSWDVHDLFQEAPVCYIAQLH